MLFGMFDMMIVVVLGGLGCEVSFGEVLSVWVLLSWVVIFVE